MKPPIRFSKSFHRLQLITFGVQKSTECIFAIIRYLAAFGSVGALIIALLLKSDEFLTSMNLFYPECEW